MSLVQLNTLPSLSGVASGSRFTLQAPVGRRSYQKIGFDIAGTLTKANVENIEVLVAGLPVQQWKALTDLEKVSSYYGYNVDPTAEFCIPFYKRFLTSASEASIFNYGTADVPTLQIRGDLGTQASLTGLTAYSLETTVADDNGAPSFNGNALGVFEKVRNFTYSASGAGTLDIDNIPREAFLNAIHLFPAADVITNVEVFVDNVKVWDASKERMTEVCTGSGRTVAAGDYHIDFLLNNALGSQLTLAGTSDFRLRITHSATISLTAYAQYLTDFATA